MSQSGENQSLPQFRLDGKVALVTGAGKGIGRACAERLAEAGARVIAVARSERDLRDLQNTQPDRFDIWTEDVSTAQFLGRLAELAQLDILVNNVGTNKPQPFLEVERDALDLMIDLNIRAAFLTAQAAARIMVQQRTGSIIHMSSQMGHIGAVRRTVYCTTKHAIEGLTKAMAVELAPLGIRVNAVAPTFIETPMTKPMLADPVFSEEVLSKIPLNRVGQVDEVADAVLFLASPASSLITGDSLKVDGGWTAQ